MRYRWSVAPPHPLLAGQLARELRLNPLVAQCLLNRGLNAPESIRNFLQPRLKRLSDPFLLPNMTVAVDRLFRAREKGESVLVFGDYDVDGVTSTALLLEVLRPLGWKVDCYLPHRLDDGYGLSFDALETCLGRCPATLLLAVDCGSTATKAIAALRTRGIDVIVLDHHQVATPAPDCVALVNPHLPSESGVRVTHGRELCSAGLAFKLAHALVKQGRNLGIPAFEVFELKPLLELVALGTIADLVPLNGENRILVSAGLERLSNTHRPGLVALKRVAQSPAVLGTFEVGFQLGPRLNAAGRLETANQALELLLERDPQRAFEIARALDERNRERQTIERAIAEEAVGAIRAKFNPEQDYVIVEGQAPWHIGVVGIVASRVLHQFCRPTIILGGDGDSWRGSGRSISGFDLAEALRECGDLLLRHGGHAMAAGVSLLPKNVDPFRERLNEIARRAIKPECFEPLLHLDAEAGLEELTPTTLTQLAQLKPTGQGNPPVQLHCPNLAHQRPLQRIGLDKKHVKMWVTDGGCTVEAVWWNAGNESLPVGRFDLAFTPLLNSYNGQTTVQLKVLDWRSRENGKAMA